MRFDPRSRVLGSPFNARVGQWDQRSIIKSIQRGTIDLASATSNTATITSVRPENSLLRHLGMTDAAVSAETRYYFAALALTNATTITATGGVNTADVKPVSFEVIEFWPGILRLVQRGTISLSGATSNTATISPALQTVDKATLDLLGFVTTAATTMDRTVSKIVLTNTTTITATKGTATDAVTVGYQVAEFY